jgi:mono/diheme cytochrome c family protein
MARWKKIVLIFLLAICLLLAAGISVTVGWRPILGPRARKTTARRFESTPQRLQRGEYLAEHVSGCVDCHSPVDKEKELVGQIFPIEGFPGKLTAPNLTPDPETGLGNWSDDEIARAIREGVSRDGHALFPIMPYSRLRDMSDEDLASVVVYLRSVKQVRNALPKSELPFALSRLINTVPEPVKSVAQANYSTPISRGEYMVKIAECEQCHSPTNNRGEVLLNLRFGGGTPFDGPWGHVAAANITFDPTGIPYYDEKIFIQAMRTGLVAGERNLKPIMPWKSYMGMTDEDLAAIFAYLKTVPPVHHRVANNEEPTLCTVCGLKHGGGSENGPRTSTAK